MGPLLGISAQGTRSTSRAHAMRPVDRAVLLNGPFGILSLEVLAHTQASQEPRPIGPCLASAVTAAPSLSRCGRTPRLMFVSSLTVGGRQTQNGSAEPTMRGQPTANESSSGFDGGGSREGRIGEILPPDRHSRTVCDATPGVSDRGDTEGGKDRGDASLLLEGQRKS